MQGFHHANGVVVAEGVIGHGTHLVRGLALGAVSHGVGTGRLLHDDETQGAFSGLAMGLTALATSALMPVLALMLFAS